MPKRGPGAPWAKYLELGGGLQMQIPQLQKPLRFSNGGADAGLSLHGRTCHAAEDHRISAVLGLRDATTEDADARLGFSLVRLVSFSDGMFSIIATLLVVPLVRLSKANIREIDNDPKISLADLLFISGQSEQHFGLFFCTFWLVVLLWLRHDSTLRGMEYWMDALGWLFVAINSLQFLAISILPLAIGLAAWATNVWAPTWNMNGAADEVEHANAASIARWLYFLLLTVAALNFIFQIMVFWHRPHAKACAVVIEATLELFMCTAAIVVSYASSHNIVYVGCIYCATPLMIIIARVHSGARARGAQIAWRQRFLNAFSTQIARSRLEAFTDGVITISMTLVILDLQPPPSCSTVLDAQMCTAQQHQGCLLRIIDRAHRSGCPPASLNTTNASTGASECATCYFDFAHHSATMEVLVWTFMLSFVLVSLLWQQHNRLQKELCDVHIQPLELMLNTQFCIFVALIPFAVGLVQWFHTDSNDALQQSLHARGEFTHPDPTAGFTALVFACTVLFGASLCLFTMRLIHTPRVNLCTPCYSRFALVQYGIMPLVVLLNGMLVLLVATPKEQNLNIPNAISIKTDVRHENMVGLLPLMALPVCYASSIVYGWKRGYKAYDPELHLRTLCRQRVHDISTLGSGVDEN